MKRSILAWCLAVSMAFSMTPAMAFADDLTAGDAQEFLAEASEDDGDDAAETDAAKAVGDGIAESDDEETIVEADKTENEQDGITEAEDAEEIEITDPDTESADEFCDSEEEVVFADGETAAADLADADSTTTVGLGVDSHTVDEIVAYMKANNATLEDEVTYATEPVLTESYSAGVLSDETKNSALAILNNVRYIAGLSEVTLDADNADSQQAASLISALNGNINHYPTQPDGLSDDLYSLGYSGCKTANLAAGSATLNKTIVHSWMEDSDSSNISRVGHRRWCLNPSMGKTAFGAVTGTSTAYSNYYSMYAFDESNSDADETLVAWPAQQMPLEYFDPDEAWSLSVGKAVTASDITVTLTRGTESWSFSSSDSTDGDFYVNNDSYGQEGCIIFRPGDITYADGDVFTVTVTGLDQTVSYTVNFFELDDYWHTHAYSLSNCSLSADYAAVSMVYTCACGDTYTETAATTITITTEATCETSGQKKISFKDKNGYTYSTTRTIAALGHNLTSTSVSDYVITGTCSRCGETVSQGVVTGFRTFWKKNSGSGSSGYSTALPTGLTAGDTQEYLLSENYITSSSGLTDIDEQFVVESSDTDVISVSQTSDITGTLTMKKGGKATITFYPKYNSSLTKTYTFTVSCGDGNHTTELQNAKDATCTAEGYTGDTVCTVCGETTAAGTTIAALGHGTTELKNKKTATCTEEGYTGDKVCTVCGETVESGTAIAAAGHTITTIHAKEATCTAAGYSGDKYCTVCGQTVEKGEEIPMAHTTVLQNAKEATCTAAGYSGDKYCTVCGQTVEKGEEILMAHTTVLQNAKEATCTEDGYSGDEICTVCGAVVKKGEILPAADHSWDDEKLTKATLTEDGKIIDRCSVCGAESDDYEGIAHPAEISLDTDIYTFDNKVKTPEVTVTDTEGYELSEDSDYTVEYAAGRKNPGAYGVVITFCGDYSGTAECSFTIIPKGTTIRRLKAGKKSITVTLKKQKKQTTGYQIQYSTSKTFRKAKLAAIKKNSTTKAVLKKLKSGKKYYVRIRTYTKVNGKTYYSDWSKVKTVKVK